ncbi:MAG: hypothetical protein QXH91_08580 [Candidatus Bathyarchaeia archaeon]
MFKCEYVNCTREAVENIKIGNIENWYCKEHAKEVKRELKTVLTERL